MLHAYKQPMVGTSLLHYRILRPLGSGGMGEVYAALDTKLNRTVALKILPASLAGDAERLARFQREAQAVAALNHPHVVTVFAVEEDAGTHFLTMELVEGSTLTLRIKPGGLALRELLQLAIPLVDAVAAAHDRGVVHRDLKPANVMVTIDGRIKVLDFGLAKLRLDDAAGGATAPTQLALTHPHQVFGTPHYMSPEQIEAGAVDQRTDIFSLGIICYEAATGSRPFHGGSPSAIMSAILRDVPPPLATRRPDLPAELDRIIKRCLLKDPARRYQSALDLKLDLEELQSTLSAPQPVPSVSARWTLLAPVAVALAVLAGGYAAFNLWNSGANDAAPQASFRQVTSMPTAELYSSLSPDGKWILYAGEGTGNRDIYLQSTSGETPINLTRDSLDDDEQPVFSPDGEQIAFRSARDGGGLFVMGRTGERVRRITRDGFNPTWSPDGKSLAYTSIPMELRPQNSIGVSQLWVMAVDASTPPRKIYDGDATMPSWSPNGTRIAFNQSLSIDRHVSVLTVPAGGGEAVLVEGAAGEIAWNPVWAPDGRHLYFISNRGGSPNIWRIALDETTGIPRGAPQSITTPAAVVAHLSVSADGRQISYSAVSETQNIQRLPFDPVKGEPAGTLLNVTTGSRFWANPEPSPDGRQVVFYSQIQPEGDLYIINADGTGLRQLTGDKAIDRMPRWSPDGKWIACFSDRDGRLEVWKLRPDGSDLAQLTTEGEWAYVVWSPDATRLAVASVVGNVPGVPVWFQLLDPNRPAAAQRADRITLTKAGYFVPNSWSPDGRAIAGQNDLTAPSIAIFDVASRSIRKLADFGEWPVWLPDGRRVLVVSQRHEFHVFDTVSKTGRMVFADRRATIGPPRLTRDGRSVYFSRRVTEADIWLAELR
jgi:eukaryotic-like serine/threonine-protein kinase